MTLKRIEDVSELDITGRKLIELVYKYTGRHKPDWPVLDEEQKRQRLSAFSKIRLY